MHTINEPTLISSPADAARERRRLNALRSLSHINGVPEPQFDGITAWARQRWNCPIAIIAFVKESTVVFKSAAGVFPQELHRNGSLFDHSVRSGRSIIVANAMKDPRFLGHHFVQTENICSYAAATVSTLEGHRLGCICLIDRISRQFGSEHVQELERLAALVADEIEAPGYQHYAGQLGINLLSPESGDRSTFAA